MFVSEEHLKLLIMQVMVRKNEVSTSYVESYLEKNKNKKTNYLR